MKLEPWAWTLTAQLAVIAVVVTVILAFLVAWEGDRSEFEEHRALFFARALGAVSADQGSDVSRAFITATAAKDPSFLSAWVIRDGGEDEFGISRGQAYDASMDGDEVGSILTDLTESGVHKSRSDRFARSTSGLAETQKPGHVAPYFALDTDEESGARSAVVPVVRGATTFGAAGVSVAPTMPDAPIPWLLLLAIGAVVGVGGAFGLSAVKARPELRSKVLVGIIAAAVLGVGLGGWWSYTSSYSGELGRRVADVERVRDAATSLGLDAPAIASLLQQADVSFTGAQGYLTGTAPTLDDGFEARVQATHGAGRRVVIFWAALVLLLGLAIGHRSIVGVVTGIPEQPHAYLYVAPSLIGMVVLVFVPFAFGVGMSAFDNDARRYYFVGVENFIEILTGSRSGDVSFYWTLFVTVLWTGLNIALHVSIGLGLALLLKNPMLRFKKAYRVLLIVPWAIPNYITALIWKGMFNKEFGAVNLFLEKLQHLAGVAEPTSIDWLGGSFLSAFTANLVTNTWLGFPFMMVVALGALQSIPNELYEAAEVDGASRWQQFQTITLPLLKPALFPAIILGTIWTFNMFNIIYLVSGGGPNNSTEILITDAYRAFDVLGRYGFAAAYSVVIFAILLLYTMITNRITKATEGAVE